MKITEREELFRGKDVVSKASKIKILVLGAGHVGSNLIDNLARAGFCQLGCVDNDRVEEHNVNNQIYTYADIGKLKTQSLHNIVFRGVKISVKVINDYLDSDNIARHLKGWDLVVDTFDNIKSRRLVADFCKEQDTDCLHVGTSPVGFAESTWDIRYKLPKNFIEEDEDTCENPMARNLGMFATCLAVESIFGYVCDFSKNSYTFALHGMKIES